MFVLFWFQFICTVTNALRTWSNHLLPYVTYFSHSITNFHFFVVLFPWLTVVGDLYHILALVFLWVGGDHVSEFASRREFLYMH